MATYAYICQEHKEPYLFEIERSIKEWTPESLPCLQPDCSATAHRHYPGQKFYGRVKGGYGGGPMTK